MVARGSRVNDRIPDDYEIDDLVDAIIASRQPPPPVIELTPAPRPGAPSLEGIDGADEFDLDSIVDAIVTASRQPEPSAPSTPEPIRPRTTTQARTPEPLLASVDLPTGPLPRIPTQSRGPELPSASPSAPTGPLPRAPTQSPRPWGESSPVNNSPGTPWNELTPSRLPPPTGSPFAERTPFGERTPMPRSDEGGAEALLSLREPPRRPPPRPDSRLSAAEAATPPGPIDLSRVEQPTRPPVRPMQISQPSADGERDIPAGTVIGDRYRVVDLIGRGGVSVVYRVEHTLLLKRMALKVLRPELSQTPSVVDRFHREARLVCQLDDPHIVRVTDFGRTSDGSLYLVMDYVDGESLAAKLRRETRLPPDTAVKIVLEVLAGLAHAHEFGVVHRDLKPENIMVQERAYRLSAKILDFGIAKLGDSDASGKPITQVGTVFGTPRYMSPEQAAGEAVDRRTDVYSTGVILYELLTGRPPFDGETTVRILSKVLTQEAPPLGLTDPRPFQSEALEEIVRRALAKEKSDRYGSVQDFRAALEACPRA